MALRIKSGVDLDGLHYKMLPVLVIAERIYNDFGIDLWITSGLDSHTTGLHPVGKGLDTRTRELTHANQRLLHARLKRELGREYDVILESDHIHIEYDPK